jgi:folate-binding protein YgfZ
MQTFSSPSWVLLSDRGFIKVTGTAAEKFLQGQVTCDVRTVKENVSSLGAHCNVKGRILFTFHLFYFDEAYWLCLPKSQIDCAVQALKKYAVFSKVSIEDVTHSVAALGFIQDPAFYPKNQHLSEELPHNFSLRGKIPRTQLIASKEWIEGYINTLEKARETTQAAWKFIDIQSGIAEVYPETREQFTPHELNYHQLGAVSFDKGCYIGQEIVARMHYLGKLKSVLVQMRWNQTEEKIVGWINPQGELLAESTLETSIASLSLGEKIWCQSTDSREKALAGYILDFAQENPETYVVLANISKAFLPI